MFMLEFMCCDSMWYFWGGSRYFIVCLYRYSGWIGNPIIKMVRVDTDLLRQNINVPVPTLRCLCYVQCVKVKGDGWFCW